MTTSSCFHCGATIHFNLVDGWTHQFTNNQQCSDGSPERASPSATSRVSVARAGTSPEGTLRRAIADAHHQARCGPASAACDRDCPGRIERATLDAVEAATRRWVHQQVTRRLRPIAEFTHLLRG